MCWASDIRKLPRRQLKPRRPISMQNFTADSMVPKNQGFNERINAKKLSKDNSMSQWRIDTKIYPGISGKRLVAMLVDLLGLGVWGHSLNWDTPPFGSIYVTVGTSPALVIMSNVTMKLPPCHNEASLMSQWRVLSGILMFPRSLWSEIWPLSPI